MLQTIKKTVDLQAFQQSYFISDKQQTTFEPTDEKYGF